MIKSIEQLGLTLDKEAEIYKEIRLLAVTKKKAIMEQDMEKIKEITSLEQGLVATLFKLEEIREKVTDRLMMDKKIPESKTLSNIIEYLNEEERKFINMKKSSLQLLVKEVGEENRINNMLIEQKLEYINLNINLLTSLDNESKYNSDAREIDDERRNILDIKA